MGSYLLSVFLLSAMRGEGGSAIDFFSFHYVRDVFGTMAIQGSVTIQAEKEDL